MFLRTLISPLSGGSGSVETLKAWVLPYLPQSAQAGVIEGAILGPAVHGIKTSLPLIFYILHWHKI